MHNHRVDEQEDDATFDFIRMTECFERIQQEYENTGYELPSTSLFVTAMREVVKLFVTLGSAFTFVKRDLDIKIDIIATYARDDASHFAQLQQAVEYELSLNIARMEAGGRISCSRTLLRLMWALKFADLLLYGLKRAFDDNLKLLASERTLKYAVNHAYENALAEHHSWAIRRTVKSACLLLPTKESFMQRFGINDDARDSVLTRLAFCMSPLVERMYAYYDCNHILDLP